MNSTCVIVQRASKMSAFGSATVGRSWEETEVEETEECYVMFGHRSLFGVIAIFNNNGPSKKKF
jgi:hypothetical protein